MHAFKQSQKSRIMSDLEPPSPADGTMGSENAEALVILPFYRDYQYATTNTGPSFGGTFPTPQETWNLSNVPQINTWFPSLSQVTYFPNVGYISPHWIELGSYDSPPLSDYELADLAESERELARGKGKRFRDVKSLLDDLNE